MSQSAYQAAGGPDLYAPREPIIYIRQFRLVIPFGRQEAYPRVPLMPDRTQLPHTEGSPVATLKLERVVAPCPRQNLHVERCPQLIRIAPGREQQQQHRPSPMQQHKAQLTRKLQPLHLHRYKSAAFRNPLLRNLHIRRANIIPLEVRSRQTQILPRSNELLGILIPLRNNIPQTPEIRNRFYNMR